jgi:hypothetical protein
MAQHGKSNTPQGPLPSELLPTALPQPPITDPKQSLQASILRNQMDAFAVVKPVKHGEQVLFHPRLEDDVHIVVANG